MNKIYKYMKFRSEFLKKPSLRLSQRCALNDPFEFSPVQDTLDKILEDAHREDFSNKSLSTQVMRNLMTPESYPLLKVIIIY